MPLIYEGTLRQIGRVKKFEGLQKSASRILTEDALAGAGQSFDIFLSHSVIDAEVILGLRSFLEGYGYSVYVDWIEDAQLDRSKVNEKTAALLRERMKNCKSLFFAVTGNHSNSKWMPWECGYFDGYNGRVVICPISQSARTSRFSGQEYLELYPYIDEENTRGGKKQLWVNKPPNLFLSLDDWLAGQIIFKKME